MSRIGGSADRQPAGAKPRAQRRGSRRAAAPGAPHAWARRGAGTRGSLRARPPSHLRPPGGAITRGAARSEDGGGGFASPGRPPGRGRTGRAAILAVVLSAAGRARHDSQAEQGGGGRRRREPPRTSRRGRRSSSRPSAAASPAAGAARPARGGGSGGRRRGAGQSRPSGTGTAARRCGAVGGCGVRAGGPRGGPSGAAPSPGSLSGPGAAAAALRGLRRAGRAPSAWGAGMGAARRVAPCRAPTGVCGRGGAALIPRRRGNCRGGVWEPVCRRRRSPGAAGGWAAPAAPRPSPHPRRSAREEPRVPSAGHGPARGDAVSPPGATERRGDARPGPGGRSSPAAGERSGGWAGCGLLRGARPSPRCPAAERAAGSLGRSSPLRLHAPGVLGNAVPARSGGCTPSLAETRGGCRAPQAAAAPPGRGAACPPRSPWPLTFASP